ncbi:MAG: hypothetical protein MUC97_06170 [Bernardetiaceae bacterium]|jgi:hypothetical protein|nr:hypothetical protein [Bernardetiaceae bacterium]
MIARFKSPSARVFLVSFALFVSFTGFYQYKTRFNEIKFGYEYGNIASALVAGRGFSDPFDTGKNLPTAWMPPLYPLVLAGIFLLAGTKTLGSLWLIWGLRCAMLAWVASRLYALGKTNARRWLYWATFGGYLLCFPYAFFSEVNDEWLITSLLLLSLDCLYRHVDRSLAPPPMLYTCTILLLGAAASPILLFVTLGVCTLLGLAQLPVIKSRLHLPFSYRPLLPMLGAACLLIALWGTYHQARLGKFVLAKSNFWMEFYLANIQSEDGLLKLADLAAVHPVANPQAKQQYITQGELAFLATFEQKSRQKFDPPNYLAKVARRAGNAFLFTTMHSAHTAGRPKSAATLAKDFFQAILVSFLPFASLVFLWVSKPRGNHLLAVTALCWGLFSSPYVLISHYDRYQTPLLGLHALLLGMLLAHGWEYLHRRLRVVSLALPPPIKLTETERSALVS